MSRLLRTLIITSLAVVLVIIPIACSSSSGTLESITVVDPSNGSLRLNWTTQLTVTAHYSDGKTKDVTKASTYTSSDTKLATISSGGLVTVGGLAAGTVTITISYTEKDVTKDSTVTITVK